MLFLSSRPRSECIPSGEEGYLLLTVLVMVFLILIALSVAAPRVAKQIQRDKEMEAVQRGLQYRRAIQLYYKKFGNYPTDIKQLENTNQVRYLRKRYTDPMTGKDDWRIIHMGEAKVKPLGFFGQPLQTGLSSQSTGPGISPGTSGSGSSGTDSSTGTSSPGLSNSGGIGASSGSTDSGSAGSSFGPSGSGFGPQSGTSGLGTTGASFGPGSGGGSGFGNNSNGPGTSPFGTGGGTKFGGGPIVGVGLPTDKPALIEYHKQKKYSLWEFVYDPAQDAMAAAGGATPFNNSNGTGSGSGAFGSGSQGSQPGSGTGSGPGFGSSFGPGSGSGTGSGSGAGGGTTSTPQPQ